MSDIASIHSSQPFYVVNNEAYQRMLNQLKSGVKTVKTYINHCCHKSKCECAYFENELDSNGYIYRKMNGITKFVISLDTYKKLLREGCVTQISCNNCKQFLPPMTPNDHLSGNFRHNC